MRTARTLLMVAVGVIVLGLFTSFIAAVTSRWGIIPTGVTIFVGMLNLAALVCGGLAFWKLAAVVETLTQKVGKAEEPKD